jgi:ABC-2 type transport system permease protein
MSRPAPFVGAVRSQAVMEARLTSRRGENLLAMIGVPVAMLTFLSWLGRDANSLLPATLALALVASSLVNLGIATAYERGYGVLKRLGGSPIGRSGLLAAKILVIGGIAFLQVVALIGIAMILGWRPGPAIAPAGIVVTVVLGVAAFAGLGLLLAGTLRPEATLVATNVLFLAALLFGGALVPVQTLPQPLPPIVSLLPFGALDAAFRAVLGGGGALLPPLAVLAIWATIAIAVTRRTFEWE